MSGLFVKIIVCPLVVAVASYLLPNVNYASFYQPILVGLILAFAAHMMEIFLLRKETVITSDIADFVAAALIVYFVSLFLPGTEVTFLGAILTAIILGLTEIPQHRWLVRSGRTKKSPP
jgi:uncharacterized membrane protein YeaQ/YmgE (transglycosylase-associated protein family)